MTSGRQSDPKAVRTAGSRASSKAADPIQRAIGEKLRQVFDEVLEEPAPARFAVLLKRLQEQERGSQ